MQIPDRQKHCRHGEEGQRRQMDFTDAARDAVICAFAMGV